VPYKRPDLAVEAARLSGLPLVVVGEGPERARLEATAPANVRFVGHAPDDEVRRLMAQAYALLFPGEEDFGIAPVEAMAAGVPIIAYAAGGACDYLVPDINGIAVKRQDPAEFALAMDEVRRRTWDTAAIRGTVQKFGPEHFRAKLQSVIDRTLGRPPDAQMTGDHGANNEAPLVGDGGGR
jgi:glycosyltransferase involved in cell wall biosynthesis